MSAGTTPEFATEAETLAILTRACQATGLSADGARLLRLGSNAVYRLASPAVARIAYADTDAQAAWLSRTCVGILARDHFITSADLLAR